MFLAEEWSKEKNAFRQKQRCEVRMKNVSAEPRVKGVIRRCEIRETRRKKSRQISFSGLKLSGLHLVISSI
ncbi:hypothetical protein CLW00_103237 [Mongoliibacter ruber]|uniref:Uncharacterized protein n=1 Tax=Mongoliibacter ruber TaxID=1750599 RepID=A0A2T0WR15_9BACT|nr:hypothetical protein CLW00_103237 [Mongoliibacter ruber]